MKRGILFVAIGMTVAGVASANVFTAPSPNVEAPPVREATPVAALTRAAEPAPKAESKPATAPIVHKASLEVKQAPVPLQVKARPPVNLPAATMTEGETAKGLEAATDQQSATVEQVAVTPSDSSSENAAKAAIESDGYKGVRVLRKGADGVWHAQALRGKTLVLLTVDVTGSVSAE